MSKRILNIIAVVLLIAFPFSVFGVDLNNHYCSNSKVHLVSLYHKSECGYKKEHNNKSRVHEKKVEKKHTAKFCCSTKKEITKGKCTQPPDCKSIDKKSTRNDDCCIKFIKHLSLNDTFVQTFQSDTKVKRNFDIITVAFNRASQFSSHPFFEKPKVSDIKYSLPRESILEFIYFSSLPSPDDPSALLV